MDSQYLSVPWFLFKQSQACYWLIMCCAGNGPCLGYRKTGKPYQWLKYKQVFHSVICSSWSPSWTGEAVSWESIFDVWFLQVSERAEYLGSGLLQQGLTASPDSLIGIFAQNRPEVPVILLHLKMMSSHSLLISTPETTSAMECSV